jgi:hypothetical protein
MNPGLRYWLVAFQGLFALALTTISSRDVPFVFTRPMVAALIIWGVGCLFLSLRLLIVARRDTHPVRAFRDLLADEREVFARAFSYALLIGLAVALHGWAKSMIPHTSSYWADPMLADLDYYVFGQDPWPLFRNDAWDGIFAKIYVSWFPITFGTMGVLAFSKRDHSLLLTAYIATLVIAGTIGQYLLPSVGPIFYEKIGIGTRFAELVATNDPTYNKVADYLWTTYETTGANLGSGISAMPSLHVTHAVWVVFAAHALWRPLAIPAVGYALIIWAASIASGWHYASDGVAGAAIAVLVLVGLRRLETRRQRQVGSLVGAPQPA